MVGDIHEDAVPAAGNLNSQNVRMLRALVIAHIVACLIWVAGDRLLALDISDVKHVAGALGSLAQALSVGFLTLATLATIAMTNLVPPLWKARLVYLQMTHPLPGCRAFSKYAMSDDRIDVTALTKVCGRFPSEPAAQNSLWYGLLIEQQVRHTYIAYNHRVYLLLADSAALILVLLPLTAIIFSITHSLSTGWMLLALMLGEVVIACLAARNAGVNLVTDVLSLASHPAPRSDLRRPAQGGKTKVVG